MRFGYRSIGGSAVLVAALAVGACGGGTSLSGGSSGSGSGGSGSGTGTTAANVVAVTVDAGPLPSTNAATNTLYTTVTVCVPGSTTQCQTIDHIQVDTGSYGLRILSEALTLSLPVAQASDGNSLTECTQFVDGYSWGPVATADVQVGGESAASVPVQVIGLASFANLVPAACSQSGPAENKVAQFGANGIIGIGPFAQDCGQPCVTTAAYGYYYSCTSTGCNPIAVSLVAQVPNPVTKFAVDNNGTILSLPAVADAGAATVSGTLTFGIDTQANNKSGNQTVLTVAPSTSQTAQLGDLTITYKGSSLPDSFIDSGSNGVFFNDSSIPVCTNTDFSGFYCPTSTLQLSLTLTGDNAVSEPVSFDIGNAETLANSNPTYAAIGALGGQYTSDPQAFDFGLPFYFGRQVSTAIEGYTTSVETGPYVAF